MKKNSYWPCHFTVTIFYLWSISLLRDLWKMPHQLMQETWKPLISWGKNSSLFSCLPPWKSLLLWKSWVNSVRNHNRVDARDQDISARSRQRHWHQPRVTGMKKIRVHFSKSREYLLTYFVRENILHVIVVKFFEHVGEEIHRLFDISREIGVESTVHGNYQRTNT